jgi:hypothetical protein
MATPEDLNANAEFIRLADRFVEVPGGEFSVAKLIDRGYICDGKGLTYSPTRPKQARTRTTTRTWT